MKYREDNNEVLLFYEKNICIAFIRFLVYYVEWV